MSFEKIREIKDDGARVAAVYEIFNEDTRLNHSKAARVEFLTTNHIINRYLQKGNKIMDIGAGAGEYSLHFAEAGFEVTAVELAEANIKAFRNKLRPELNINLHQGNACDLSKFDDNTYDIVLVFGPLYHLSNQEDRSKCIREAMRVCKEDGMIFFAFISNDMVILTETFCYNPDFLISDQFENRTFKVEDFPFVFFTAAEARNMLLNENIQILMEVAVDGVSELLADKINEMDDESYQRYLNYHLYCCEKPEMLGHSNHLLFGGKPIK